VFTSIILAKRSGKVLYQYGADTLRMTDTAFLFAEEPPTKAPAGNAAHPPKEPPTSTMHLTRRIGDPEFGVFVQPIPVLLRSDASGDAQGDWLLIGLSENKGVLKTTAPSDLLIFLPFLVLLALFTWPLPKLWCMS